MMVYSSSQRLMAPPSDPPAASLKTAAAAASKPAPRVNTTLPAKDDADTFKSPRKAHTFPIIATPSEPVAYAAAPDAFETGDNSDADDEPVIPRTSIELHVLPIELITLTDSFIDSLGAKVHSTPPSIDRLSRLFQDFYGQASTRIGTHLQAQSARQSRDVSPTPSAASISSAASRLRSKATALTTKDKDKPKSTPDHQMLTPGELAERKRARRALEIKQSLLEEAVERRLCEGIYDRIYRHRTTQDEAQDDKLRSKTAALDLVGITPADLGVDLGVQQTDKSAEAVVTLVKEIRELLGPARRDMVRMAQSKYPLGKLNHLKSAHKSIVDTIAHFHPSASADEIMPMLIFTLVTLPPENLHVISDISFIQHFRAESKLTGEAAYCLTNLEAAISFLQTVDLTTLRADESLAGPPKTPSQADTPRAETFPPAFTHSLAAPAQSTTSGATASRPAASPGGLTAANVLRNRRLSDLVNTPAQAFGAASDAVFNTADQGLKTISNSLGDSYKFFIGKIREHQDGPQEPIAVPRTLDEARKLVSTPPPEDDDLNTSAASSTAGGGPDDGDPLRLALPREERPSMRKSSGRDRSEDSTRSGRSASSSKRVLFAGSDDAGPSPGTNKPTSSFLPSPGQNPAVLDQMRNLSNSFNPMARLSNMGMMRGFGRNAPSPGGASSKDVAKAADGGDLATAFPDIAATLPPKPATKDAPPPQPKVAPPNRRFMELQSPGDLKLGEVLDLLRDYRRLAGALKDMDAFADK